MPSKLQGSLVLKKLLRKDKSWKLRNHPVEGMATVERTQRRCESLGQERDEMFQVNFLSRCWSYVISFILDLSIVFLLSLHANFMQCVLHWNISESSTE